VRAGRSRRSSGRRRVPEALRASERGNVRCGPTTFPTRACPKDDGRIAHLWRNGFAPYKGGALTGKAWRKASRHTLSPYGAPLAQWRIDARLRRLVRRPAEQGAWPAVMLVHRAPACPFPYLTLQSKE